MMRSFVVLAFVGFAIVNCVPFKGKDSSPPSPHLPFQPGWGGWDHGGGWEKPAYDINPHFGFRQYSEMRYEPLTTPYTYSTQLSGPPAPQQPLIPLLQGEGPPYSPYLPGPIQSVGIMNQAQNYMSGGSNSLYDDGYAT